MTRERTRKQKVGTAPAASAKAKSSRREAHLPQSLPERARDDPKLFVDAVDASVARRVESLVDMLAWVRIEMASTHPDGVAPPSDHERLQRALVQVEMALAMTKQLAMELRRQQGGAPGSERSE